MDKVINWKPENSERNTFTEGGSLRKLNSNFSTCRKLQFIEAFIGVQRPPFPKRANEQARCTNERTDATAAASNARSFLPQGRRAPPAEGAAAASQRRPPRAKSLFALFSAASDNATFCPTTTLKTVMRWKRHFPSSLFFAPALPFRFVCFEVSTSFSAVCRK